MCGRTLTSVKFVPVHRVLLRVVVDMSVRPRCRVSCRNFSIKLIRSKRGYSKSAYEGQMWPGVNFTLIFLSFFLFSFQLLYQKLFFLDSILLKGMIRRELIKTSSLNKKRNWSSSVLSLTSHSIPVDSLFVLTRPKNLNIFFYILHNMSIFLSSHLYLSCITREKKIFTTCDNNILCKSNKSS